MIGVVRAVIPENHEDPQSPVGESNQLRVAVFVCFAAVRLYASFGLGSLLDCEPGPGVGRAFLLQLCSLEALKRSVTVVSPGRAVELTNTWSVLDFRMSQLTLVRIPGAGAEARWARTVLFLVRWVPSCDNCARAQAVPRVVTVTRSVRVALYLIWTSLSRVMWVVTWHAPLVFLIVWWLGVAPAGLRVSSKATTADSGARINRDDRRNIFLTSDKGQPGGNRTPRPTRNQLVKPISRYVTVCPVGPASRASRHCAVLPTGADLAVEDQCQGWRLRYRRRRRALVRALDGELCAAAGCPAREDRPASSCRRGHRGRVTAGDPPPDGCGAARMAAVARAGALPR